MYTSLEYLNHSKLQFKDKAKPLIVESCGIYRLRTKEKLPTWHSSGQLDYQLIYVAAGKVYFYFGGEMQEITAGHMILFQPKQEQHYEYFAKDKPEVYWVHFTGSDVENILRHYSIPLDRNVIYSGSSATYTFLFKEMINESQSCRTGFQELLEMYLRQIFLLVQRSWEERKPAVSSYILEEIEYARRYFNEHYHEPINIENYAQSRGMSVSWFLRNFKQVTAKSPMQYILSIRITNAVSLLENTDYNITEIAAIIGYDNPLYFSRIFRKQKGVSPSEFRKIQRAEEDRK